MTLLLKEQERSQQEWNRKARDAVNMLIRRMMGGGATTERPPNPVDGQLFYDRTLKRPLWWNSEEARWLDASGDPA
ncbi:hypothetical protein [Rhizorhabdus phycosphaerae]|uniref:hypothetical protein n=1 Tax=Rhizorhabdus phycosphaerae TaxID=2711156 RepID=UPI0013EBFCC7|nr:hypothetical protein [Rhizorhabdus phycosphaerae]